LASQLSNPTSLQNRLHEVDIDMSSHPQPAPAEMKPVVSATARFSLLIACLAIILALQYPLLLSYFQRLTHPTVAAPGGVDRSKLLDALSGFSHYRAKSTAAFNKKRKEYNKLPSSQKQVRSAHLC
jgi:hypothetical protein